MKPASSLPYYRYRCLTCRNSNAGERKNAQNFVDTLLLRSWRAVDGVAEAPAPAHPDTYTYTYTYTDGPLPDGHD
jgi:hypothetical protein